MVWKSIRQSHQVLFPTIVRHVFSVLEPHIPVKHHLKARGKFILRSCSSALIAHDRATRFGYCSLQKCLETCPYALSVYELCFALVSSTSVDVFMSVESKKYDDHIWQVISTAASHRDTRRKTITLVHQIEECFLFRFHSFVSDWKLRRTSTAVYVKRLRYSMTF